MSQETIFDKQIIPVDKQIKKLEERGLIIEDHSKAKEYLKNISYFRLQGFWWEFQADKQNHFFIDGTKFEDVIRLYTFDRKLRLLLFDGIERIEIAIRTKLVYYPSIELDQWWFEDSSNFFSRKHHEESIEEIKKELNRTKEVFIKSHYDKYGTEHMPPSYKTLEVVSFGCLSKLYGNLNNQIEAKNRIAHEFNLPNHNYLRSWLKTFNTIRNIIAHHSRLWNRSIDFPPKTLHTTEHPFISVPTNPNSVYHCMSCIIFVLNKVSPEHSIKDKIIALIEGSKFINLSEIGAPTNWREEDLWK